VTRAISDFGDGREKELDTKADGVRRSSARNAVRRLWTLLNAEALPRQAARFRRTGGTVDG